MKTKLLLSIVVYQLCIFFLVSPVFAEPSDMGSGINVTEREQGIFAFFRLGDKPPDFEHWVKGTEFYQELPDKDKEDYLIRESIRLGTGYSAFDPRTNTLHIEVAVIVQFTAPKDGKPGQMFFQFPGQNEEYIPTFSYPYGTNEWVSMIINRLALFSAIPLKEDHYQMVSKHLFYENTDYEALITVDVRPTEADHEKPIRIGNMLQWIMISEIAYMRCEIQSDQTGQMVQIWDFVAPWYTEEYKQKNLPEDLKYPHPFDLKK